MQPKKPIPTKIKLGLAAVAIVAALLLYQSQQAKAEDLDESLFHQQLGTICCQCEK